MPKEVVQLVHDVKSFVEDDRDDASYELWLDTEWAAADLSRARQKHPKERYRVVTIKDEA